MRAESEDSNGSTRCYARSTGYPNLERRTVAKIWCGLGRCSDCPTPTPDPTSTGRPPKLQQVSLGTGEQPLWSQQRNSKGHPLARQRPKSRTSFFRRQLAEADSRRGKADPPGVTTRTGRQGREGQRQRVKLRTGRDLHDAGPTCASRPLTLLPETPKRVANVSCIDVLLFQ